MLSAGSKSREPRQRDSATRNNGTHMAEKKGFQDAGDCKKSDSSEFTGKMDLLVVNQLEGGFFVCLFVGCFFFLIFLG